MKVQHYFFILLILALFLTVVWFGFFHSTPKNTNNITPMLPARSFDECVVQGNAVMESYPRQCRDAVGQLFVEELPPKTDYVYENASDDVIRVELPTPNAVVGKAFSVLGEARGFWFFEASFPVELRATDGTLLAQGIAQAGDEWMTEEFVPFKADLNVTDEAFIGEAMLTLKRDNPSDLPENDASASFPIIVEY